MNIKQHTESTLETKFVLKYFVTLIFKTEKEIFHLFKQYSRLAHINVWGRRNRYHLSEEICWPPLVTRKGRFNGEWIMNCTPGECYYISRAFNKLLTFIHTRKLQSINVYARPRVYVCACARRTLPLSLTPTRYMLFWCNISHTRKHWYNNFYIN